MAAAVAAVAVARRHADWIRSTHVTSHDLPDRLQALGQQMRTGLTMLGMIIGVAAVITLVAMGNGAQSMIEDQIRAPART